MMGRRHLELVDLGPEGLCGAETADGTPCQRPAGDDGTCWEPTHRPGGSRPAHLPEPPIHLGEVGQECWWHHVERLWAYGVLERADTTVVEKASELYEMARLMQADIRENGSRVQGRDGTRKKNPALSKYSDFTAQYRQHAKQIDRWIKLGERQDPDDDPSDPLADW